MSFLFIYKSDPFDINLCQIVFELKLWIIISPSFPAFLPITFFLVYNLSPYLMYD